MSESLKCPCAACGTNIEFPAEYLGEQVACPSCNEATLLRVASSSSQRADANQSANHAQTTHTAKAAGANCPNCGATCGARKRNCDYCGSALLLTSAGGTAFHVDPAQSARSLQKWRDRIRDKPDDAEAQCALGMAYLANGLREEAIPYLRTAAGLAPEWAEARYNFAVTLFNDGELLTPDIMVECRFHFERIIRIDPDFQEAQGFHCFFQYVYSTDVALELRWLEEAIGHCPDIALFHRALGRFMLDHNEIERAEAPYLTALELEPEIDNRGVHINLAVIYCKQRRWEEAILHASKVMEPSIVDGSALKPPELILLMSYALWRNGQETEAKEYREAAYCAYGGVSGIPTSVYGVEIPWRWRTPTYMLRLGYFLIVDIVVLIVASAGFISPDHGPLQRIAMVALNISGFGLMIIGFCMVILNGRASSDS